jgi:hypothetical protein
MLHKTVAMRTKSTPRRRADFSPGTGAVSFSLGVEREDREIRGAGEPTSQKSKSGAGENRGCGFGHRFVKDDRVIPENYSYVFFEPGIEREYRYILKIPYDCKFLLVRGQFLYAKGNPHSAERVVTVKTLERPS